MSCVDVLVGQGHISTQEFHQILTDLGEYMDPKEVSSIRTIFQGERRIKTSGVVGVVLGWVGLQWVR
jgi:hypothetical protein